MNIDDCSDSYCLQLKKEYNYLCSKFGLTENLSKPEFFGLWPLNFPTIRVSQLDREDNSIIKILIK
ncbi:DUF2851 family protein [Flagellimonas halotolerans]|uniref:DUF2851 family protein n=1 Tax=Flagellimonas halotolerans TaxID=3112164 RepID=A0ABU6IS63_9FLAO|nr:MULTISPECIES: DUF2851 family protein [unclassified Allomuricauda]MEC3965994.1 DUF2851 family protein [Muricauda sp. SYSU M86414]MEC4265894.1 DUF2851 family protein [Muricauda sp. SYSU M84420]